MYSHRSINSGTIQGGGCQTDEIPDDNSLISEEETCKVYPIKKRSLPIIEESEKQIDQQAQPTKEHQENKLDLALSKNGRFGSRYNCFLEMGNSFSKRLKIDLIIRIIRMI